jgi:Cu(I)/Ag(I) efflux system membrane fusion protein
MTQAHEAVSNGGPPSGPPPPPPSAPPPSEPPPKGPRLGCMVLVLLFGLAALTAGVVWSSQLRTAAERAYGAILQLAGGEAAAPAPAEAPKGPKQYYTCGMHPWVVLPQPGDCPICHMKLVPLDPAKFTGQVTINPVMTWDIGVRTAPVTVGPVTRIIRTVGMVDYNENLVWDVNLKVAGWIEKLHVTYVGQPVEKGQPLFELYSPELYTAQEEYLLALKGKAAAKGIDGAAASPELARMEGDLLAAARKRLQNFDISDEQIVALEKSGTAAKTMTIRSPRTGLVIAKTVYEGMRVETGMQPFRIADHSKVWVLVTLYEYQLPFVEVGQKAVMTLPYLPGQKFEGKITYIYPHLDTELRQVKVRLEFDNPDLFLKPGMFATIELASTLAKDRVLVPREAVTDTGLRRVAFVSMGEGRFEPRDVRVGAEAEGGMIEILDGLKPGEMVVTSGEFLLDSEARLREALAKMIQGNLAAEQKGEATAAPAAALRSLPEDAAKALSGVLDGYFQIGEQLASDSTDAVAAPARQVAENVNTLLKAEIPDNPHFWHQHTEVAEIRGHALELVGTKDIEKAREHYADLSIALSKLVRASGVPPGYPKPVEELHCPMYREGQGGTIWLHPAGEVKNPYYGKKMIGCFDWRVTLPVTGAPQPK